MTEDHEAEPPAEAQSSAIGLTEANKATLRKAVRPQYAAAIILIDRSGPAPKVLLGRRNKALKFLPGKYAFPGGRLELDDKLMAGVGALDELTANRLSAHRARRAPPPHAFAVAAIRELFEETGLLAGSPPTATVKTVPPVWQAFAEYGFAPNLAPLRFVARAITPPAFPRRYDTSFFLVDASAIAHRIDGCVTDETELVELVWCTPEDGGKLDVPLINAMILQELTVRLKDDVPERRPVPFFYERNRRWIRE
ncbi:MAG TPA: NUDIX hydrolase, partial [Methylovirgula sp.]|nr:NUDIX hydrolase [Methylovirgula sp.]